MYEGQKLRVSVSSCTVCITPSSFLFIVLTYNSVILSMSTSLSYFLEVMVRFVVAPTSMATITPEFAVTAALLFRMIFEMVEAGQSVRKTGTAMVIWSALISVVSRWMLLPP